MPIDRGHLEQASEPCNPGLPAAYMMRHMWADLWFAFGLCSAVWRAILSCSRDLQPWLHIDFLTCNFLCIRAVRSAFHPVMLMMRNNVSPAVWICRVVFTCTPYLQLDLHSQRGVQSCHAFVMRNRVSSAAMFGRAPAALLTSSMRSRGPRDNFLRLSSWSRP
jgi:hypothetical protein